MRGQQCLQISDKPSAHPQTLYFYRVGVIYMCKGEHIFQAFPAQTGFSSAFLGLENVFTFSNAMAGRKHCIH